VIDKRKRARSKTSVWQQYAGEGKGAGDQGKKKEKGEQPDGAKAESIARRVKREYEGRSQESRHKITGCQKVKHAVGESKTKKRRKKNRAEPLGK